MSVFDGANIVENVARVMVIREFPGAEMINPSMDSSFDEQPYPVQVELVGSSAINETETTTTEATAIEAQSNDQLPANETKDLAAGSSAIEDDSFSVESSDKNTANNNNNNDETYQPETIPMSYSKGSIDDTNFTELLTTTTSSLSSLDIFLLVFKTLILTAILVLIFFSIYLFFAFN